MSGARFIVIAGHELRTQLASPLFWVLLGMVALVTATLNPVAMIPSGDAAVAGVRAFVNSRHALAQGFALGSFFAYPFFAALMAGLSVLRDDEARVGDLLHSTPLTAAEYVLGKLAGVTAALGVAFAFHLLLAIGLYQRGAWGGGSAVHGPFHLGHYVIPALVFATPGIWCAAALAFAAGERTRRPMAVYAVPTVLFVLTLTLLWTWTPPGLDPRLDRLLMVLDPTGLRWLGQTLFRVDRGVAYYNSAPLAFDATLALNRLVILALPALAVLGSVRHFRRSIGAGGAGGGALRAARLAQTPRRSGSTATAAAVGQASGAGSTASFRPLHGLAMTSRPPGLPAGTWTVLRAELLELRRQPALWLFTAFLMLVVAEVAGTENDVFGAPVLLTAGGLAIRTLPVVTVLVCLYLLFAVVESMDREAVTGFDAICHATPVPTAAFLLGKSLAAAAVIGVLTAACIATGLLLLVLQSGGRVELAPLALVFGLVLAPTFLLWTAFVTAVMAAVRQRAAALAIGLAALVLTGFHFVSGGMTWASNWPLWGALRWSDLGLFPLNGRALLLNRAAAAAGAVFLLVLAAAVATRTERDAAAALGRLRPTRLLRGALRLAPVAALPALLSGLLADQVRTGFQGAAAQTADEEYWRRNVATWRDLAPPAVTHLDLRLALDPAARQLRAAGTFVVANPTTEPLRWLPFTVGPSLGEVAWTLDGAAAVPEDRAGLHILTPQRPLAPGAAVRVGFSYTATQPRGITRNGGGARSFLLPAGVLLSTRDRGFLPVPGFVDEPGPDAAARPAPAAFPDGSPPGGARPPARPPAFTTRVEVSAPSAYTVNSVGVKTAEWRRGDRTTVVWESGRPVGALNVLAGRWQVRRRDGAAVFHHAGHPANVETLLSTLAAARARYSEWFHPYPWPELRLSEFPDLETNATAFPTNISFSEGIGFLTGGDPRAGLAFSVAAHEAAHQWWGHLLTAGDGPGAGLLVEGLANYSALLLHEAENGLAARIAFARQLERGYLEQRRLDGELPLLATVEQRAADEAVLSQKGAWVLWMLHRELGRDRMLAGLRELVGRAVASGEHATPQDLMAVLRARAADPAAFDDFARQWLAGTVLPEYRVAGAVVERTARGWRATATVTNAGTGTSDIEVAAVRGERAATPGAAAGSNGQTQTVRLAPGQARRVHWELGFRPERIVVDPDALVLQLNRDLAQVVISGRSGRSGRAGSTE